MAEDLSNDEELLGVEHVPIKAQEQHTINHELDAVHWLEHMSNAGWLATVLHF